MKCVKRVQKKCRRNDECADITQGYTWIAWSVYSGLPPRAFPVGQEKDGSPVYVGRAEHNGGMHPVMFIPSKETAHITANQLEVPKERFDVLCGSGFKWVRSGDGHVPEGAVCCMQKSTDNPKTYIGRANHEGALIPGKIVPSKARLFIPFEGGEIGYVHYDVLVHHKQQPVVISGSNANRWVRAVSDGPVPNGAVCAGHDGDGAPIYVGRVQHKGYLFPAKIIPAKCIVHTQFFGRVIAKESYEALCEENVSWRPFDGKIPRNAIECGRSLNGEPVFVGRAEYKGSLIPGKVLRSTNKLCIPCDWCEVTIDNFEILVSGCHGMDDYDPFFEIDDYDYGDLDEVEDFLMTNKKLTWVPGKNSEKPPEGAVLAGYDSDRSPIYVGRVMYEGNQLPAKVIPRKNLCHTQHNGEEIEMISYEALCYGNVSWVKFNGSNIPPNALVCGRTATGEPVHVGRGRHIGSLTPGKVLPSQKILCIPFGWSEIQITNFEILIDNDFEINNATKKLTWRHTKREQPAPAGAVIAGKDVNGSPIYVGRVQHDGNRFVGKIISNKKICNTTCNGSVISKLSYEALCDANVVWRALSDDGKIPVEAIECGRTRDGERVFFGRASYGSELIPGTVLESERKLKIAVGAEEVVLDKFEILVSL